jgi:ABC-2 type transport system ATP-binding protein
MRMRTLLVGALAFRPRLRVLDEPLSGLDTLVRDEVVHGLLQQAADTTVLISSH